MSPNEVGRWAAYRKHGLPTAILCTNVHNVNYTLVLSLSGNAVVSNGFGARPPAGYVGGGLPNRRGGLAAGGSYGGRGTHLEAWENPQKSVDFRVLVYRRSFIFFVCFHGAVPVFFGA